MGKKIGIERRAMVRIAVLGLSLIVAGVEAGRARISRE